MGAKENRPGHPWAGRILLALEAFAQEHRLLSNVAVHTVLFSAALMLAFLIRFDIAAFEGGLFWTRYLTWVPLFVILKLVIFGAMKLYRGGWRYSGIRDVTSILVASWVFLLVMYVTVTIFRSLPQTTGRRVVYISEYFRTYSTGVLVLDFFSTVFLVCGARLGFRIYREELRPVSDEGVRRVLIVGTGNAADAIIREINRMPEERYRVIGLVDDNPANQKLQINGIPVLGTTEDLPELVGEHDVEEIIIALPHATQRELRRVIEVCSGTGCSFQSLPGVAELIDGKVTVSQIRPVDINDLLGREAVELDSEAIGKFLRGRKVVITGAGGSIGSEMCRQVATYRPARLILLEQAENPLFEIQAELRDRFGGIELVAYVCDITDRGRVAQLWQREQPEVVIHAAAHKHVPLMELNPCEAIKNNILGTRSVADASAQTGVSDFVMISTDKAVNPSSIMGASKRVAEISTQALSRREDVQTQFKTVRFGNVLGSAGSVVPTFRKQIARGGPVTVTHPDMQRYFMTIPEASQLVLQAAAMATGGQICLLDMGEPVKIVDLAKNMITLSGFRPGEDIEIRFTGVRPGEKIFEELRNKGEDIEPTDHPKVLIWKCAQTQWERIRQAVDALAQLAERDDREPIVAALQELVPDFRPPDDSGQGQVPRTSGGQASSESTQPEPSPSPAPEAR